MTMPDQFTLAQFQRRELDAVSRAPVMAEIALISSHAPWTPIPEVMDWAQVIDGSEFTEQARAGDPPEVMWQDKERVLKGYRDSIRYVLQTLVSYVMNHGNDDLVLLVLGDHQPMPYVTEESENRDVPVHLIARDPAVLEAISHQGMGRRFGAWMNCGTVLLRHFQRRPWAAGQGLAPPPTG